MLHQRRVVAGQRADALRGARHQVLRQCLLQLGLAQVGEAVAGGGAQEVADMARRVVLGQQLTEDVGAGPLRQARRLGAQDPAVGIAVAGRLRQLREEGADVGDALARRTVACMLQADVADDVTQMPARQHVVADRRNTAVGQHRAADPQDRVLGQRGNPAIDAVADHIVEPGAGQVGRGDVALAQFDIAQAERRDPLPADLDMPDRQVQPEEPAPGKPCRQRNDVATRGAADFQHARGIGRRYLQSMQRGHRGQSRRLAVGHGHRDVRQLIVVAARLILRHRGSVPGRHRLFQRNRLGLRLRPRERTRRSVALWRMASPGSGRTSAISAHEDALAVAARGAQVTQGLVSGLLAMPMPGTPDHPSNPPRRADPGERFYFGSKR